MPFLQCVCYFQPASYDEIPPTPDLATIGGQSRCCSCLGHHHLRCLDVDHQTSPRCDVLGVIISRLRSPGLPGTDPSSPSSELLADRAGHRHQGRCRWHWHSGILYLSPVTEHSGTGQGPLFPVPDWFRHLHFCSFGTGLTGCRTVRHTGI
jgi:hypothetical protein